MNEPATGQIAKIQDDGLRATLERSTATATAALEILESIDARLTGSSPGVEAASDKPISLGAIEVANEIEHRLSEILNRVTAIRDAL